MQIDISIIISAISLGVWDDTKLQNAVTKGWITQEEYEEITGEPYEGEN